MTTQEITHKDLVKKAAAWLKDTEGMTIVVAELTTAQTETPDCIGFGRGGHSVLVECKISRSDFLSDKNKHFRRCPEHGMGTARYFMVPKGMVSKEELPESWGLVEVTRYEGKRKYFTARKIVEATNNTCNKQAEVGFLTSVIRRLELSTCVYVRQEEVTNETNS